MKELKNIEQTIEHGGSVKEVLEESIKENFDEVVVMGVTDDRTIKVFYSLDDVINGLGILEAGKKSILEDIEVEF